MSSKIVLLVLLVVTCLFALKGMPQAGHGRRASTLNHSSEGTTLETATFGAGCFWHVEDAFRQIEGVVSTAAGFEGGIVENPTYHEVSTDLTGHAEVVQVKFDPAKVSYEKLLEAFFALHDPTTLNRQGPDIGIQYRSVIFYHSPQQKASAEALKVKLSSNGHYKRPIVTEITPASTFWKAEEYHQQYYDKHRM